MFLGRVSLTLFIASILLACQNSPSAEAPPPSVSRQVPAQDYTAAPSELPLGVLPLETELRLQAEAFYDKAPEDERLAFLNFNRRIARLNGDDVSSTAKAYLDNEDSREYLYEFFDYAEQNQLEPSELEDAVAVMRVHGYSKDSLFRLKKTLGRPEPLREKLYSSLLVKKSDDDPLFSSSFSVADAILAYDDEQALTFATRLDETFIKPLSPQIQSIPTMNERQKDDLLQSLVKISDLHEQGLCQSELECRQKPEYFELIKQAEASVNTSALSEAAMTLIPKPIIKLEGLRLKVAEQQEARLELRKLVASFAGTGGAFSLNCSLAQSEAVDNRFLVGRLRADPEGACQDGLVVSSTGKVSAIFDYDTVSNAEASSTLSVPITFEQSGVTTEMILSIVVDHADRPLEAQAATRVSGIEGQSVSTIIRAEDPDGDEITFACTKGCRPGLEVDRLTGEVSFSPGWDDAGSHKVSFVATAAEASSFKEVTVEFLIENKNRAPQIFPVDMLNVREGESVSTRIIGHDPDGDELTLSCIDCLDGARVTEDGFFVYSPDFDLIEGSVDTSKVEEFEISASDGDLVELYRLFVTVDNVNRAAIIGAVDPVVAQERQEIFIKLSYADPDGPNPDLVYECHAGCPTEPYHFDRLRGEFRWTPGFHSDGVYDITFRLNDGDLKSDTLAKITVENLIRPPDEFEASIPQKTPKIGDVVDCDGQTTDIDGERLKYSYRWLLAENDSGLGDSPSELGNQRRLELKADEVAHKFISCEITADDSRGGVTVSESAQLIYITNTAPNEFSSNASKSEARVGDVISCFGSTSDADLDQLDYLFQWQWRASSSIEYSDLEAEQSDVIQLTSDHAHGQLRCFQTAKDLYDGVTVAEPSGDVDVLNSAPNAFSATTDTIEAPVGTVISCLGETEDVDLDELSYTYKWFRQSAGGSGFVLIDEADESSYSINPQKDRHGQLTCEITADDGMGGQTVSSLSGPVQVINSAPNDFSAELIESAFVTDEITCLGETTDVDLDEISDYRYQWFFSQNADDASTPVSEQLGGKEKKLTINNAFAHGYLKCSIEARDGYGGVTVSEDSTNLEVLNSPPEPFSATVDKLEISVDQSVSCGGETTDVDLDELSGRYTHRWMLAGADGEPININQAELTMTSETTRLWAHNQFVCETAVTDGYGGETTSFKSPVVSYINTEPLEFSAEISGTALVGNELSCLGETEDPDFDELSYSYRWYHLENEGLEISESYETKKITVLAESAHKTLVCQIVAKDPQQAERISLQSEPEVVLNSPPHFADELGPTSIEENKNLDMLIVPADVDGDQVTASCSGCPPGSSFVSFPGLGYKILYTPSFHTLTSAQGQVDHQIKITLEDSLGARTEGQFKLTVFNVDQLPQVTLSCSPRVSEGDDLLAGINVTDPDNEPVTISYQSGVIGYSGKTVVEGLSGSAAHSYSATMSQDVVGRSEGLPVDEQSGLRFVETKPKIRVQTGNYDEIHECSVRVLDLDRPVKIIDPCPASLSWKETEDISWHPRATDDDYPESPEVDLEIWQDEGSPAIERGADGVMHFWASYDAVAHSGTYAGSPSARAYYRLFNVNLKASSDGIETEKTCLIRINDVDRPPVISSSVRDRRSATGSHTVTTSEYDSISDFSLSGSDPDGDAVSFSFPSGGSLQSCSRLKKGSVSSHSEGSYSGVSYSSTHTWYWYYPAFRSYSLRYDDWRITRQVQANANGLSTLGSASVDIRARLAWGSLVAFSVRWYSTTYQWYGVWGSLAEPFATTCTVAAPRYGNFGKSGGNPNLGLGDYSPYNGNSDWCPGGVNSTTALDLYPATALSELEKRQPQQCGQRW